MGTLRTSPGPNGQYLATPDQASRIFNAGGLAPVRQKHLFLVRFLRRAFGANEEWKDGLSFVVKSIDRPAVKPVLEELNQYNKKRQVQTGVKYDPINLTIYDTTDNNGGSGAAMKMWLEYASYHFGDYNHFENLKDFGDDIIDVEMRRSNGVGFGIQLPPPDPVNTGGNAIVSAGTQYYFDGLEVLQLHGNKYVRYTLVNPRISSFTPDDLDYANAEASTIQMQISYEGIAHFANGQPQALDAATVQVYAELLQSQGIAFTLPNEMPNTASATTNPATTDPFEGVNAYFDTKRIAQPNLIGGDLTNPVTTGGVLENFGTFSFGDISGLPTGFPSEVSLNSDLLGGAVGSSNVGSLDQTTVRGIYGAAQQMGLSPSDVANHDNGVSLHPAAVAIANQSNDGTSQIGFRSDNPTGYDWSKVYAVGYKRY